MFRLYFILILFISTFVLVQAQTQEKELIYRTFDKITGVENLGLYDGPEFTDPYLNTNGTFRYLNGFDFVVGSVNYRNQFYVDVPLKYDILEDNLITTSSGALNIFKVKLIPDFVSDFVINNQHFLRLNQIGPKGFFEEAYNGKNLKLYIKHQKFKRDRVLKTGVQYGFKAQNSYFFEYGGSYMEVGSMRDIRKAFPSEADSIKDFYRSHKNIYKTNRDLFMTKLATYLDSLQITEKS